MNFELVYLRLCKMKETDDREALSTKDIKFRPELKAYCIAYSTSPE